MVANISTEQQIHARFLLAVRHITEVEEYATPSIRQLAVYLGLDYTHLHKIVKGLRNLSLTHAADLCRLYQINPTWLLLGTGPMLLHPTESIVPPSVITRLERLESEILKAKK